MYHYLVTYRASIDMGTPVFARLSLSLPKEDKLEAMRQAKERAERRYRQAHPKAKQILITIMNVEETADT